MRPTPNEVIGGVRAILKEQIAPGLASEVLPQLKRIMSVLRDGRWNDAAFDLLRENAAFADLARSAVRSLEQDGGLGTQIAPICRALRNALVHEFPSCFADANAINRELRAALCGVIEAIRDHRLVTLDFLCAEIGTAMLSLRDSA